MSFLAAYQVFCPPHLLNIHLFLLLFLLLPSSPPPQPPVPFCAHFFLMVSLDLCLLVLQCRFLSEPTQLVSITMTASFKIQYFIFFLSFFSLLLFELDICAILPSVRPSVPSQNWSFCSKIARTMFFFFLFILHPRARIQRDDS